MKIKIIDSVQLKSKDTLTDSSYIAWRKDSQTEKTLWNVVFENEIIYCFYSKVT